MWMAPDVKSQLAKTVGTHTGSKEKFKKYDDEKRINKMKHVTIHSECLMVSD